MTALFRKLAMLTVLSLVAVACAADDTTDDPGATEDDAAADDAGTDETDEPAAGGEATIVVAQPDSLDPTTYSTAASSLVMSSFCEALYAYDYDGEIIPVLAAEEPEFSDDALTVSIPIREGVQFNDGTDLDAAAVVTSLERHIEHPESGRAGDLGLLESIEAADDETVQIELSEPFSPLVATLAGPAGRIMSPTQLDALGDDFGDDPICVGPFVFAERPDQGLVIVERSDHYYADETGLDRITFQTIEDNSVAVNNLLSGEVDLTTVAPTNLDRVEGDDSLQLLTADGYGYQGLTINIGLVDGRDEPLGDPGTVMASDPRVREAFELAIDRDGINEVVFQGMHTPGCTPITPVSPFADANPECPPYDPDQAQALLDEAGVDTPVPVELTVSNTPDTQRIGELIQSMAGEAGFDVDFQALEATTAIAQGIDGDFDVWLIGFGAGPEPDGGIYRYHHTEGGTNSAGIGIGDLDDDIDAALDAARQTDDQQARIDAYAEALELIQERRSHLYLYHPSHFVGAHGDLAGTDLLPHGMPDFKRLRWSS